MYTAMLTAENIAIGTTHDVWNVNVEEEYHETATPAKPSSDGAHGTGRDAPVIAREHYGKDHPLNRAQQLGANAVAAEDERRPTLDETD